MCKSRAALLGVLALVVASGFATSTASATGGPFWYVGGSKLTQETRQVKLQLKGTAVLRSEVALLPVIVTCRNSVSEGASVEGSGAQKPGQDKGRLSLTQCETTLSGNSTLCKVGEPIVTNQTKSRLVTYEGGQAKYADLFEPQQGTTFVVLKFEKQAPNSCPIAGAFPVNGSIAAELVKRPSPELVEGLMVFPVVPIARVFWWGNAQIQQPEELSVGLRLGAIAAKFNAAYGTMLDNGETLGFR